MLIKITVSNFKVAKQNKGPLEAIFKKNHKKVPQAEAPGNTF